MTRARLVVGLFALFTAYSIIACTATASSSVVIYKVTGSSGATTALVTSSTVASNGAENVTTREDLPFTQQGTYTKGSNLYLSAVNDQSGGCVTAEIDVNGGVYSGPITSCGQGAVATASGTLH